MKWNGYTDHDRRQDNAVTMPSIVPEEFPRLLLQISLIGALTFLVSIIPIRPAHTPITIASAYYHRFFHPYLRTCCATRTPTQ